MGAANYSLSSVCVFPCDMILDLNMECLTCHSVSSNFRYFIISEDSCNSRYYGKRPQTDHSGQHPRIKLNHHRNQHGQVVTAHPPLPSLPYRFPDADISYPRLATSELNENDKRSSRAEKDIQKMHISCERSHKMKIECMKLRHVKKALKNRFTS